MQRWDKTVEALKHFGFKTDEAKSHWRMENRTGTRDVPAQGELVSSGNRGDGELDDGGGTRHKHGEGEVERCNPTCRAC